MLGLIIWAIFLFVIVCYAYPGFFTMTLICLAVVLPIYTIVIYKILKRGERR